MPSSAHARLSSLSFPTRRSSDLGTAGVCFLEYSHGASRRERACNCGRQLGDARRRFRANVIRPAAFAAKQDSPKPNRQIGRVQVGRSEEHTSELQSLRHLVCRLLPTLASPHSLSLHDALPIWGLLVFAFLSILTARVGVNALAIVAANSAMLDAASEPTLYGRQLSPRNRIVQSQTARSAAYR